MPRRSNESEFSILRANLLAVPCIVVIFLVSARVQLDDPISSAAGSSFGQRAVNMSFPQHEDRTMKMKYFLAALLLVPSLAMPAMVQARTHESSIPPQALTHESSIPPQAFGIEGREVAAPPWSAACMTDHGPSQCDEPMWVYGSPSELARYKNAF
jgi:hypothetical protein